MGEFNLPATDDMEPTDYVLDGQQRLTVIYSCLGAKETDGGFAAIYDLEDELFLRMPDERKLYQFPLRQLFNTTLLLDFRAAIRTLPKGAEYQSRLDGIVKSFTEYRLPVVTLKDLSVEEVCPIFERINSSGTKLSIYDLMVAATWNREFDLHDEIAEVRGSLSPKGFDDIDRETVLKCLSAVHLGTIKERSMITLRGLGKKEIERLIEQTKMSLLETVDLLSTEFHIFSWDFLSYEALAVVICYIYAKTKLLTPEQVRRIRQWFWRSSFGERYKVGGENFVSNDLQIVFSYVVENKGSASIFGSPPSEKEWWSISFRSNVSRSRAFMLALAARKPRDITNGSRIDVSLALSSYNKRQFHHVYPRAHLRRIGEKLNDNLLINICMLTAAGNNEIADSNPKEYVSRFVKELRNDADEVFASNPLPAPAEFDYSACGYRDFLVARIGIVARFIERLCNGDAG